MQSQPPSKTGRKKGSVSIVDSHNRLQLHFRYCGKRHYLSLNLPADDDDAREMAQETANTIERDMKHGYFDTTLKKYKREQESALSVVCLDIAPSAPPSPSLAELWGRFVEHKRPQCSPNTMLYVYGHFTTYIEKLPTLDLSRAVEIKDFSVKKFPLDSCKRFLTRLSACCNWAMKAKLIPENPFLGMASEIKLPSSQKKAEDEDCYPFTPEERDSILQALAENTFCNKHSGFKHSFYQPYLEFLFMTGCRPSEAIALRWKHISKDFRSISFEQAVIETGSGRKLREGLKTQERRRFPCNGKVQALLKSVKLPHCDPESLVFPGYSGGYLDTKAFRKNIWKPVLLGLGIEYRKPYQTRHTFITLALEHGLDAKDVARLVGNSPEVIYRHYAGNKRDLCIPEF